MYLALWVPNGLIVGCESLFVPYAPGHAGLLFAFAALGMLAGDTLAGRFVPARWRERLGAPLRLLLAAPYLIFALQPALPIAVAAVTIASVGYSASLLLQQRLMALTPDELSGHALGLQSSGMLAMQGVGAAIAGMIAEHISPGAAMAVMAAMSVTVTLLLAPGLRRRPADGHRAGAVEPGRGPAQPAPKPLAEPGPEPIRVSFPSWLPRHDTMLSMAVCAPHREGVVKMIIDCAHYQDGRSQDDRPVSIEDAAARRDQGGFVWLGLFEPDADELAQVRRGFGLHELAVEDAQNFHLRPEGRAVRRRGAAGHPAHRALRRRAPRRSSSARSACSSSPDFVITVRQGVASELRGARLRLEAAAGTARQRQPAPCCGRSSTRSSTATRRSSAGLERDIDQIEATVFSRRGRADRADLLRCAARPPTSTAPCTRCWPVVARSNAARPRSPDLARTSATSTTTSQLVNEEVAAQRDLLGTVLEANIAVISVEQTKVSVRQNTTIEQLTMLATVFLPLTFVTGFFGQNFGWLVNHIDGLPSFLILGIGGLVLPLALLFFWLRRRSGAVAPGIPAAGPAPPQAVPGTDRSGSKGRRPALTGSGAAAQPDWRTFRVDRIQGPLGPPGAWFTPGSPPPRT